MQRKLGNAHSTFYLRAPLCRPLALALAVTAAGCGQPAQDNNNTSMPSVAPPSTASASSAKPGDTTPSTAAAVSSTQAAPKSQATQPPAAMTAQASASPDGPTLPVQPPQPTAAGSGAPDSSVQGAAGAPARTDGLRDVLLVGNSVSGSVSFLDGNTHENLGSISVIPDMSERMAEINASPVRSLAYTAIKSGQMVTHFEPSGGDRFIDDVFVSPEGTTLYASRSNLGDVAAFDLTMPSHPLLWHTVVDGNKADHATLSPDGTMLIVSATTADVADVLDAKTGKLMTSFQTGHYPHQNDYSADGKHIYNGSIGSVGSPQAQEAGKGLRQLTVVDAQSFAVVKTYMFEHGIRPSVITPDEKFMYSQQSYLNGLIKFDLTSGTIVGMLHEPLSEFAKSTYKSFDEYPHDSAHHGLAMSGDGSLLCDAGTIDNTVSIVTTADLKVLKTIDTGNVPYWATASADGNYCFVSLSGDNAIAIIDFKAGAELKRIPVGKFPQRNRLGHVRAVDVAMFSHDPG